MDRCVVRQAIKEAKTGNVIGYELLFQGAGDDLYDVSDTSAADMISSFLMNNSSKLVNDKTMFITFTPALLFRNAPKMFEPDKVIIEIGDNLIIHPLAQPIIKKYCELGYQFAINSFQFSPKYFGMLEYANYIRLNITDENLSKSSRERISIENIIGMAQRFKKKCIATGVDSKELYDCALEIGVDYLQGQYVAATLANKVDKVKFMQGNFFQLVVAVAKDEPDMVEIEEIVSRDAGLAYALLKLVNSAYFALRRRTASIRQALVTLGIDQLRQWVYMLSFDQPQEEGANEILKLSFVRAKFASEISSRAKEHALSKGDAYMMGMFSTLGYMVDAPLEEVLEGIPINEDVREALISQSGQAGKIYQLTLKYEQADWKETKILAEELQVPTNLLAQIYIDCVDSVNEIWNGLTTEHVRPGEVRTFSEEDKKEHIEDIFF